MGESKKYSKMLNEVESIVEEISSADIDLDKMVDKVEKGFDLIKKMRERLDQTKEKIEVLRKDFDEKS
jgi:exodeoxyribonuclease VII small subunit